MKGDDQERIQGMEMDIESVERDKEPSPKRLCDPFPALVESEPLEARKEDAFLLAAPFKPQDLGSASQSLQNE
jgi:hypothetical protein